MGNNLQCWLLQLAPQVTCNAHQSGHLICAEGATTWAVVTVKQPDGLLQMNDRKRLSFTGIAGILRPLSALLFIGYFLYV
jgi:hypothetical protein